MSHFNAELLQAQKQLQEAALVLLPSRLGPIITCDGTNPKALQKLKAIGSFSTSRSLYAMVAHDAMLEKYVAQVPQLAYDIMDLSNKPVIIVYDRPKDLPKALLLPNGAVGMYVAHDKFVRYLIGKLKKPLAFVLPLTEQLPLLIGAKEKEGPVLPRVDYVVNLQKEESVPTPPSIIQLSNNGKVKVIRQ